MRISVYRLHRSLSIIIAIPVLLWAGSGFMHPLMTNIRPAIATQGIPVVGIDSLKIRVPISVALRQHHLDSLSNFRLVHIDTNWFYQVQVGAHTGAVGQERGGVPIYISCNNGNILPAGDWLYAQYLARQFLEGPAKMNRSNDTATGSAAGGHTMGAGEAANGGGKAMAMSMPMKNGGRMDAEGDMGGKGGMDCCGAATDCVLNPAKGAKVDNVSLLKAYDDEYKSINRLLPVYRVSFARADGIRVYVETTQDRFSFAMDNRRAVFDEIFRICHTWGWLDFLGKGRLVVEILLALAALCTTLMGIYLFFTTRSKRSNGNGLVKARRRHRYTAIFASLFTLLWTFSGAYHAFTKLTIDDIRDQYSVRDHFPAAVADVDYGRLQRVVGLPLANVSLVSMGGETYWRAVALPVQADAHKDLMKDKKVAPPVITYVHAGDYVVLPEGDMRYADWVVSQWSGRPASEIGSTSLIATFGDEYNFTDKRLPVWKVSYDAGRHERYYIETSTGRLASYVNDRIVAEGYSFSVFHKHHFMDAGGKTVRDGSTMFWALVQVVMVVFGVLLWFRYRARKK